MLPLIGGIYLGWALGANDAANVFGTAVGSRIISFWKAALLCAVFVIIGAVLQGREGIKTLSGLTEYNSSTLLIVSISAAVSVTLMTIFRLPISTSQAMVGAIAGLGLSTKHMHWGGLVKVVVCWIATPVGALIISLVIYKLLSAFLRRVPMSLLTRDKILWGGLLLVGIYGSYALGANNVANVTGIYSGQINGITDILLALFGGCAIAVGILTYSRRVMLSVGSRIMSLNAFTAFVAVSSMAITVHVFAFVGVPVSTSQAIVGAIVGIGFMHGINSINLKNVRNIVFGWLLTPVISLILSAAGYAIFT